MTATVRTDTSGVVPADLVSVTIDGTTVSVAAGPRRKPAPPHHGNQKPPLCDQPRQEPVGARWWWLPFRRT
ncbi:hypothetical protein [Nocardia cyriacigeorgica]|uniref:hypothetical protein n=1 Tax=Nocardia cyriacigeorgica TaxID=135487 RepID=UPI0024556F07|nr:hypothetical protein [Nocardia cyriacigeorgica]